VSSSFVATALSVLPPLTHWPVGPSQLAVLPMQPCHFRAILPIEAVSFGSFHWRIEAFKNECNNPMGSYWVLMDEANQQLLGYVGGWQVMEEAHITTVAIHPQARGANLGELLFTHLLGHFKANNVNCLMLEVRVTNFSAQNLYYKYGFKLAGRRPRYYQDNDEDALLLTCEPLQSDDYQQLAKTTLAQTLTKPYWQGHPLPQNHTANRWFAL
jgi:[ribosomal protein S18]-alanine N-acetyltransferase